MSRLAIAPPPGMNPVLCSGGPLGVEAGCSLKRARARRHMVMPVDESLKRYLSASEAGDIEGIMGALTADVEVVSPISGRMVVRGEATSRFCSAPYTGASRGCAGRERSARMSTGSSWGTRGSGLWA